jgi:hypothetical protein
MEFLTKAPINTSLTRDYFWNRHASVLRLPLSKQYAEVSHPLRLFAWLCAVSIGRVVENKPAQYPFYFVR